MESQESTPDDPNSRGFTPSLEYAGTSGHAEPDTSAAATVHADLEGITAKAQRYALIIAQQQREHGVTVAELRETQGNVHHGRVSSALTNLHKAGRLVALRERRGHCGVYVLPEYVDGREVREYKPSRKPIDADLIEEVLAEHEFIERPTMNFCICGQWQERSFIRHQAEKIAEALG